MLLRKDGSTGTSAAVLKSIDWSFIVHLYIHDFSGRESLNFSNTISAYEILNFQTNITNLI
jgi:hypothetical protein